MFDVIRPQKIPPTQWPQLKEGSCDRETRVDSQDTTAKTLALESVKLVTSHALTLLISRCSRNSEVKLLFLFYFILFFSTIE